MTKGKKRNVVFMKRSVFSPFMEATDFFSAPDESQPTFRHFYVPGNVRVQDVSVVRCR